MATSTVITQSGSVLVTEDLDAVITNQNYLVIYADGEGVVADGETTISVQVALISVGGSVAGLAGEYTREANFTSDGGTVVDGTALISVALISVGGSVADGETTISVQVALISVGGTVVDGTALGVVDRTAFSLGGAVVGGASGVSYSDAGLPDYYEVDFSASFQDLYTRANGRLLVQFRGSLLLNAVMEAFISEVQLVSDTATELLKHRSIWHSANAELEVLGRLVGIKVRPNVTTAQNYNLVSEAGDSLIAEDGTHFVIPVQTTITTDDATFKQDLLIQIASNFNKTSSVPEIVRTLNQTTDRPIFIKRLGPMSIELVSIDTIPTELINRLSLSQTNTRVDEKFLLPIPVTTDVTFSTAMTLIAQNGDFIMTEGGDHVLLQLTQTGGYYG